jgi:hypothetical protein
VWIAVWIAVDGHQGSVFFAREVDTVGRNGSIFGFKFGMISIFDSNDLRIFAPFGMFQD